MEEVLYRARTHPKVLFSALMIQLVLAALHVALALWWPRDLQWQWMNDWVPAVLHGLIIMLEVWFVVVPLVKWWNDKYTVTTKRVRHEWGVLYKHSREIRLSRISSISEERGILDRIFGAGTLNFYDAAAVAQPSTSGAWNDQADYYGIRFHDVPRVKEVRRLIETAKYSQEDQLD